MNSQQSAPLNSFSWFFNRKMNSFCCFSGSVWPRACINQPKPLLVKLKSRFRLSFLAILVAVLIASPASGRRIKIVSYNVQNLFDTVHSGTEYPDYVPGAKHGWNKKMALTKASNIARVLADVNAEVILLQEVENERALALLQTALSERGSHYPFRAVAASKPTTVKCAALSRLPIHRKKEISVGTSGDRNILELQIDVDASPLTVFINHWKSRRHPESRRLPYARALKARLDQLPPGDDYLLAGDFNACHDAFRFLKNETKLNDTGGTTAINHILPTMHKKGLFRKTDLIKMKDEAALYNLWLELVPQRRWSHNFFGQKKSLDSMLISPGLFDAKGISYVDRSFDKFDPDYLFKRRAVFSWRKDRRGRGRHLGVGYSDHLPIFASFTTAPFQQAKTTPKENHYPHPAGGDHKISNLYSNKAKLPLFVKGGWVIYKRGRNAILKQSGGRAVYLFRCAADLEQGQCYDLIVTRTTDYYGLKTVLEITNPHKKVHLQKAVDLYQTGGGKDYNAPRFQNEVIAKLEGTYFNGRLRYGNGKTIRLYFRKGLEKPPKGATIQVRMARIGYHRTPEIVIESPSQWD